MKRTLPQLSGMRIPAAIRIVLLLLCTAVAGNHAVDLWWTVAIGATAAVASWPRAGRRWELVATTVEGLVAGCAIAATGLSNSPYLPYLIAPAFAGGLTAGLLGGILPLGFAAAAILASPLLVDASLSPVHTSAAAQWIVLSLVVAVVASWVRSVLAEANQAPSPRTAQIEALRLLTELRDVARGLPGTLDPATSAETMLARARELYRFDVGAVLVAVGGSRQLTLAALSGHARPEWDLSLNGSGQLAQSWRTQQGAVLPHRLRAVNGAEPSGSAVVVPLLSGVRPFGLVVLESGIARAFPDDAVDKLADAADALTLALQTGLVFDEVRELATYEERRRLAREIHDGIAQELASLAYSLDMVAADAEGQPIAEQVDDIRDEVRRLVTELRMSLFDLRSDIDPEEGLGAAIGRHVRGVGTASGMTVHLSLNEGPLRLSAETEAELLRIVQEAVANARKHSRATNLWVTCTVDPPGAEVSVEDDGLGLTNHVNAGSHGLAIMRERAERIRADLTVEPRDPQGTKVRVSLGKVRT